MVSRATHSWILRGLIAFAAVVVLVVLSGGSAPRAASDTPEPSPLALSHYAILNRLVQPADMIPALWHRQAQVTRRIISSDANLAAWVTLEGERVCIFFDGQSIGTHGASAACNNVTALTGANALLVLGAGGPAVPGESDYQIGLAPNGVSAVTVTMTDGMSATVPVEDNTFVLPTPGHEVVNKFAWRNQAGVAETEEG